MATYKSQSEMYRSYRNSNIFDMDDDDDDDVKDDEQYGAMPEELSDVEVSCEAESNADNIRPTGDDRKRLVRRRQRNLKLFDDSHGYIYNKFSATNSGKSSEFGCPNIGNYKGDNQTSNGLPTAERKRRTHLLVGSDYQVVEDGPEFVVTKTIDSDLFRHWSKVIPRYCQALITKARNMESIDVGKSYEVDSSIEMCPVNGNLRRWRISLRRDGTRCYRKYGKKNQKGRKNYVDYVTRMILDYKEDDLEELNKPAIPRQIRKLYKCPASCGEGRVTCGFYVCEPYCIQRSRTYYAAVRSTGVRVITICPRAHENNERWVQTEEAWEAVCDLINCIKTSLKLKEFPVEGIYINFGRWQSQAEKGRLALSECHAHINIMLTRRAIEACKGRNDVFGILEDSIFAPKDYRYHDTLALAKEIECGGQLMTHLFNYPRTNHFWNLIVPSELADCEEYFKRKREDSDNFDYEENSFDSYDTHW